MNRRRHARRIFGFTLIEVLIAVSIISFLGVVIYTTFYQGMNLWHRASKKDPEMEFEFFFDEMSTDLRSRFLFQAPPFVGKRDSLEFYALVPNTKFQDRFGQWSGSVPARIRYAFDKRERAVRKEIDDYFEVLLPDKDRRREQHPNKLLEGIKNIDFEFYTFDEDDQEGLWKRTWQDDCWPRAVKTKILYGDAPEKSFTKVIALVPFSC